MRRVFLMVVVCSSALSFADVASPTELECSKKQAGEACRAAFGAGVCTPKKCSRNDYSQGIPPKTKEIDCLLCEAAPSDAGTPADAGTSGAGGKKLPKKK